LSKWLETVLTKGAQMGLFELQGSARLEAESFMSMVYGAMLTARAFSDPKVFADIVESGLGKLLRRADAEAIRS
jgi:TetR/AcrR family transcriptional repressor of nem operon